MGTAIIGLILKVVVGCILAVLGLYLTALVVGERQTLRKTSTEHNTLLGKSIRVSLFFLVLLIAVVIALSCYVSLWFLLILIPSVFLGFALLLPQMSKSAAKKYLDSKSEREYEAARARLTNKKSYTCIKCGKKTLSADKVVKLQGNTYCRNCALNVNAQIDEQQWIVSEKDKPPKQVTVGSERPKKEILPRSNFYKKGDFIGQKYEVYDVLGEGGFGIVYLVYSREAQSVCALKTFRDEYLENVTTRERFKKEAQVWIDLERHPYLVRAYFVDEISGKLYIQMEHIASDETGLNTLAGYLRSRPPDLAQSLKWSIQFCHGMEHAYSKGIKAHRDIKPANIMISTDKTVKISDFGLAGVIGTSKSLSGLKISQQRTISGETYQTMEGSAFGTPPYMPPEQFENAAECDERSDIYSFGIVLYQMASGGKLPFYPDVAESRGADVFRDWYMLHCKAAVPKLKSPLFPIIFRCLEKNPINRYVSFKELRRDLETLLKKQTGEVIKLQELTELEAWELVNKGFSLVSLGKCQEAIACYDKAIEINPRYADAWYNKGAALGKIAEAQQRDALRMKASIISDQIVDTYKEAIACYDKMLELNPLDAETLSLPFVEVGRTLLPIC